MFSVIIPLYNASAYIAQCVGSVIDQKGYDGAYEIIIVNDGSTDNSAEVCRQLVEKYPDVVRYFEKENGGQFSARSFALAKADHEYIIPLDADDMLREDAFAVLSGIIRDHDPDMVIFRASKDEQYRTAASFSFEDGEVFSGEKKKELYTLLIGGNSLNSFCMKAYKKRLLDSVEWNGELIASIRNGEDLLQLLPVITKADVISYTPEILYYYRPNSESVSQSYSKTFFASRKIIYDELKRYLAAWGMDCEKYDKLLRTRTLRNLTLVIKNLRLTDQKTACNMLQSIAADEWFRSLYRSGEIKELRLKDRFLLGLVYYRLDAITCFVIYRLLRR